MSETLDSFRIVQSHSKLPVFHRSKTKFEDFWALFMNLVNENSEARNVKMTRLRQTHRRCITGLSRV